MHPWQKAITGVIAGLLFCLILSKFYDVLHKPRCGFKKQEQLGPFNRFLLFGQPRKPRDAPSSDSASSTPSMLGNEEITTTQDATEMQQVTETEQLDELPVYRRTDEQLPQYDGTETLSDDISTRHLQNLPSTSRCYGRDSLDSFTSSSYSISAAAPRILRRRRFATSVNAGEGIGSDESSSVSSENVFMKVSKRRVVSEPISHELDKGGPNYLMTSGTVNATSYRSRSDSYRYQIPQEVIATVLDGSLPGPLSPPRLDEARTQSPDLGHSSDSAQLTPRTYDFISSSFSYNPELARTLERRLMLVEVGESQSESESSAEVLFSRHENSPADKLQSQSSQEQIKISSTFHEIHTDHEDLRLDYEFANVDIMPNSLSTFLKQFPTPPNHNDILLAKADDTVCTGSPVPKSLHKASFAILADDDVLKDHSADQIIQDCLKYLRTKAQVLDAPSRPASSGRNSIITYISVHRGTSVVSHEPTSLQMSEQEAIQHIEDETSPGADTVTSILNERRINMDVATPRSETLQTKQTIFDRLRGLLGRQESPDIEDLDLESGTSGPVFL